MKKWKRLALALALGVSAPAAFAPVAAAQSVKTASDLSGAWRGVYQGSGNQPTEFSAQLVSAGDALAGSMIEPNTFGAAGVAFLLADVRGSVVGDRVRFTKTYDGTGGQSHSVTYDGRLSASGRRIVGTWSLAGATGAFEMVR